MGRAMQLSLGLNTVTPPTGSRQGMLWCLKYSQALVSSGCGKSEAENTACACERVSDAWWTFHNVLPVCMMLVCCGMKIACGARTQACDWLIRRRQSRPSYHGLVSQQPVSNHEGTVYHKSLRRLSTLRRLVFGVVQAKMERTCSQPNDARSRETTGEYALDSMVMRNVASAQAQVP